MAKEQLEDYLPPDDLGGLMQSIQPYMGKRRDTRGVIPWEESVDANGLFPLEIKHLTDLSKACFYMDAAQKGLVMKAAVLALIAHQNQYRDSTHPYSDHLFSPTITAVTKYELDEITVASALLHDGKEDCPDFWPVMEKSMPSEVVRTINDLSKYPSPRQKGSIIDEEARMKVIGALLDNPRVALIKTIIDRLNNMKTLHYIKSPGRRRAIINETQQMYVSLAELLGFRDEARELDDLCLRQLGREYAYFAEVVSQAINKHFPQRVDPDTVLLEVEEIKNLLVGGALELYPRLPTAHDIYRKVGTPKAIAVTPADYYLNIDAVLTNFSQDVLPVVWGREALEILNILIFNGFKVGGNFNLRAFQEELTQGLTDSLPVDLVRESDGLHIHLTVYPQLAYDREQATIASMYYRRPPKSRDEEIQLALDGEEIARKHLRGMMKAHYLREKYERAQTNSTRAYSYVLRLESRLPVGQMRVIGCNDEGLLDSWQITQGATVMDYAKSIFHDDWPRIIAIEVRRGDEMVSVPFDYILSPGETIHVIRGETRKARWDPVWIHSFRTDEDGREWTKIRIRAVIEEEKARGRLDMRNRVIKVGRQIIERYFDPSSQPLRIDVSYVTDVIKADYPDMEVTEFEFMVGMGEIGEEKVRTIAQALEPINRRVGVFRVNFARDDVGQTKAIAEILRRMKISILSSVSGRMSKEGQSFIEVYIDPQTLERIGSNNIIQRILSDQRCRDLHMQTLDFTSDGKTEIYPVKKQKR